MDYNFSRNIFDNSKSDLLKKFKSDTGISYKEITLENEIFDFDRNGITSIIEAGLGNKETESLEKMAFITKQLYSTVQPKDFKKNNDQFLKYIKAQASSKINSSFLQENNLDHLPASIHGLNVQTVDSKTFIAQFNPISKSIRIQDQKNEFELLGYALAR